MILRLMGLSRAPERDTGKLEAAKRLAQGGVELVLVSRNAQKAQAVQAMLQETYGAKVHLVSADFARLEDVRKAAALIRF